MKKKQIILTVILSSLLPTLAVAEGKKMQNTQPQSQTESKLSQSEINMKEKKHMSMGGSPFSSQSATNMKEKKHMSMGNNPFSSHDKQVKKVTNEANKGYTVKKYKK